MVLTSLKTPAETMQTPPVWIPATPSLAAYGKVSEVVRAGRSFVNSAIIATTTTAGILLTSLLAGFAFAKYEFRGKTEAISSGRSAGGALREEIEYAPAAIEAPAPPRQPSLQPAKAPKTAKTSIVRRSRLRSLR